MSEMVERIARALARARYASSFSGQDLADKVEGYWGEYEDDARAALGAMRPVLAEIRQALLDHSEDLSGDGYFSRARDFHDLIAKLDAALSPTPERTEVAG
jgi:hypothetical protein